MLQRIAYLNTQYPSLSHTFIEREIRWVRAAGIAVRPISIRRPNLEWIPGKTNRDAYQETTYLLDGVASLLMTLLIALIAHPFATARTILKSQRLSQPGLVNRLRHLIYVCEAIRLSRCMDESNLRHVHVHMANNGAAVALLATIFNPRLSYSLTIHGPADFFDISNQRLKEKAENATFVRCISDFCRGQVMTWTRPDVWDRFHVVHCGIDPENMSPTGPNNDRPLSLLAIGRFSGIKGFSVLLNACARLAERGIDWRLTLIGDGPLHCMLQQQATELGIDDRVRFTGPVSQEDIQQYFEQSDLLVVSSFLEGVPTVLMEAMAKGLPVIATNVAGVAELVEHEKAGWVIRTGSSDQLIDAISQAWHNRDQLPAMGRAGREKVCSDFNIRNTGQQMSELFKSYLTPETAQATETGSAAPTYEPMSQTAAVKVASHR